jgi:ABC-2 type transport system permease protein
VSPDTLTVARKELREILSRGGATRSRRGLIGSLVFPVLFGAFMGVQAGRAPTPGGRGFAVFPVGLMAMAMAGGLVSDAVAGERERHTLETLLASPASDADVLSGKLLGVVSYAWLLALVQLVAIAVFSSVAGGMLSPALLALVAVLALLEATLAAVFGVQFSIRAPTVRAAGRRQAQFAIFINIVVSAVNVLAATPTRNALRPIALTAAFVLLVAADVVLFNVARRRFRRGRLLLD